MNADALLVLLREISASGVGSFENIVRDLLARMTGRRLWLAKSGPQGGLDARTDDERHATVIAVEAKRYGAATTLSLDSVQKKIDDAAIAHADLDLWILAASREVKVVDRAALRATGEKYGVAVLILDWPESAEMLPGLLLMAAAHADILEAYGLLTPEVRPILQAVRDHPTYAAQLAAFSTDLLHPALGYANARDEMALLLRGTMASMSAAAVRIGRYANLTDPAVLRVDRSAVTAQIATWWGGARPLPTLALLGPEGMGKTWAALGWWLDRERAGNPLPLTLVVPGRSVVDATPDAVVGRALFDHFGTRDATWWARRARRWCTGATDIRLILIIDGLNERFEAQDWSLLAAQLRLEPWDGAVATIITDRLDHWRLTSAAFASAGVPCTEQAIDLFSDEELDAMLLLAGLDRAKLDSRLIPLLKRPRLCMLAIRHWEALGRSGDITPERLIYEDFRDRVYPGIGDDDMRNLVAAIGEQIRTAPSRDVTVLRRDIRAALADESGAASSDALVSDIASGVWFSAMPGEPHHFKLNPVLAPVAIGLALARATQTSTTAADVRARIDAFVDDLRGLELGVTIVGIAASFATLWPGVNPVARDTLLDTWLASDNFSNDELGRYSRVIQEQPDFFIDRTEAIWRDRNRLYDDRHVHLAGLVNAAEAYPSVMTAFVARSVPWLGETFGWRDVVNGGEPIPEVAASAVVPRVKAWNAARGHLPALTMIEPGEDEDFLSVASTMFTSISYLPRAPFAAALGAYAVSTALTRGAHFQRDRFAWLLRANTIDPREAEVALIAEASAIAAVAHPDAQAAANILLDALTPLDPLTQPVEAPAPPDQSGQFGTFTIDGNGIAHWDPELPRDGEEWGAHALRRLKALPLLAGDPEAELTSEGVAAIRAAFEHVLAHDQDRDYHLQDGARAVLARWAPDLLARYLMRTANILDAGRGTRNILHGLQATWVLHDAATSDGIRAAYDTALAADGSSLDVDLVVLALADRDAAGQYDAFAAMPLGPRWPKDAIGLLKAPGPGEFARYAALLDPPEDPRRLGGWLGLLIFSRLTEIPPGFAPVAALFAHPDAGVRTAASRVAGGGPDQLLANMFRDTGWTSIGLEGDEAVYGSLALASAEPVENDDRAHRVIPNTLGFLSRRWPQVAAFADAFANYVRTRVAAELAPRGTSRGFGYSFNDRDSYDRLVGERGDDAEAWLQPALSGASINFGHMWFAADKAVLELSRALIDAGRPVGAAVWRALVEDLKGSNFSSSELPVLPFRAVTNGISDPLRYEILATARYDGTLYDAASALQKRDQLPWLIAAITRLFGGTVLDRAKALVLAGELDDSPEAHALWNETLLSAYLPRWLAETRTVAHRHFRLNRHARYWLARFCAVTDPLEAFAAFELFALTASRTTVRWATAMVDDARATMSARTYQHWQMNVPRLNQRLKAADKEAGEKLAFDPVPKNEQAPWRG